MMDAPWLFPRRFNIDVSAIFHSLLCEIEIISFGIVGAKSREGTIGGPLQNRDGWIFFFDA